MIRKLLLTGVIALLLTAGTTPAWAMRNDLFLWRFCQRDAKKGDPQAGLCLMNGAGNSVVPDNRKFAKFSKEFSAVLAPKFHAPADSLGWSGWNMGFEFTINQIPGGDQWDDALEHVERFKNHDAFDPDAYATRDSSAQGHIDTVNFHFRKGFPFSTELGFNISYLIGSSMFMAGVEGKFTFLEEGFGNPWVPRMAVRMNYGHLFGSDELDVDQLGWDLSISETFAAGSIFRITPYTGYSIVYSMVRPSVLNPTFDGFYNSPLLSLEDQDVLLHRWFIGVRFIAHRVAFTPEIIISNAKVYSYSFNLGADF